MVRARYMSLLSTFSDSEIEKGIEETRVAHPEPVLVFPDRFEFVLGRRGGESSNEHRGQVPEVGGPIDPDNEAHDLVMSVFGGMSKGERNRIKIRVRTAMSSQVQLQGRYLGGRPPYGYRITDAGPHPYPPRRPPASASTHSSPTPTPLLSCSGSSPCMSTA